VRSESGHQTTALDLRNHSLTRASSELFKTRAESLFDLSNAPALSQESAFFKNIDDRQSGPQRPCRSRKCSGDKAWFRIVLLCVESRTDLCGLGQRDQVDVRSKIKVFESEHLARAHEGLHFIHPHG